MEIAGALKNLINRFGKGTNKIFYIALSILTIIFSQNSYKSKAQSLRALNSQKDAQLKKNAVLAQIQQSEKRIELYKNFFSKKDASSLINTINNMARDSNIKIISIKPGREEAVSVYTRYPFILNISANSYHAVGKFISKIENHPDVYFVDAMNIKMREVSQASDIESGNGQLANRLAVNLVLSVIVFKG